jgi:methionine sulfoxide reductase heme-binding subunit
MTSVRMRHQGRALLAGVSLVLTAIVVIQLQFDDFGTDGIRLAIRTTARTSLVLFALAFSASAVHTLAPAPVSRWLLQNRRYLGLTFAFSHALHLAVIFMLVNADSKLFWTLTERRNVLTGSIAYAFIVFMSLTSTNRLATKLGPANWRRLHVTGSWYVFATFAISFAKRVPKHPFYAIALLLLAGLLILRVLAHRKVRSEALLGRGDPKPRCNSPEVAE